MAADARQNIGTGVEFGDLALGLALSVAVVAVPIGQQAVCGEPPGIDNDLRNFEREIGGGELPRQGGGGDVVLI